MDREPPFCDLNVLLPSFLPSFDSSVSAFTFVASSSDRCDVLSPSCVIVAKTPFVVRESVPDPDAMSLVGGLFGAEAAAAAFGRGFGRSRSRGFFAIELLS